MTNSLTQHDLEKFIKEFKDSRNNTTTEDFVNESIIDSINKYDFLKNERLKEIVINDFKEIEICYENEANKATLVLLGSILECILLNWLIKNDDENWIDNDKKYTLGELINEVDIKKGFKKHEIYEMAKDIKNNRNLVHPKKIMNGYYNITKNKCKNLINKLEKVKEALM